MGVKQHGINHTHACAYNTCSHTRHQTLLFRDACKQVCEGVSEEETDRWQCHSCVSLTEFSNAGFRAFNIEERGEKEHMVRSFNHFVTMLQRLQSLQRLVWPVFAPSQNSSLQDRFLLPLPTEGRPTKSFNYSSAVNSSTALWQQVCQAGYSTRSSMAPLPPLKDVETATLKAKDGAEFQAKTLWQDTPVFIYCIRRPGWCVLRVQLSEHMSCSLPSTPRLVVCPSLPQCVVQR